MAGYQTLTAVRTTEPDPIALLATLRAIETSIGYTKIDQIYMLKKATAWSGSDITAAQAAIDTAPALTPQRQAQNEIDGWSIAQRALVLALIDQLNVIRSKLSPPLADITTAQALAAIRAKAGTL